MNKCKIILILAALALVMHGAFAEVVRHVAWTASLDTADRNSPALVFTAAVDDGWHIYGLEMPDMEPEAGAPDPTQIVLEGSSHIGLSGSPVCSTAPTVHFDNFMNLNLPWLTGTFTIRQPLNLDGDNALIQGYVRYMACSETACTPPEKFYFEFTVGNPVPVQAAPQEVTAPAPQASATPAVSEELRRLWWQPVEITTGNTSQSYWMIFILGFLGGLVALMTPCIWPMIPMTVSFFLKRTKSRRRAIADAILYALSIIVIFVSLGILMTLIFGPGELNKIATGAVFNIIFFAMLVVFAISFFGAFEIKLPAKWTNAADNKANTAGGILGIFFMAFTLVLVSFSCTGPIIGTLLVEAFSQSNLMGPLLGMGGFALGLALPFGLFAFFPSMLKELPRSGSWLNSVKVVLGFIELILSLKFLSVADLAYGWHILDREVFLALWIVLFILLGMYLLGKLRFSHDAPQQHTGVGRFFLALFSLSFAVYLVPGLWGAPLKAISAFAPPLYTQDFNLYGGEISVYHDYDEGMEAAMRQRKPVLVDFSGYGCVNCRKMEGTVFDTPAVKGIIDRDFIMITLMVDDKTELSRPFVANEENRTVTFTTLGEKWAFLQRSKFSTNQQPFYIMLDNEGKPLAGAREYDENVGDFVAWLENGIEQYKNQ